MASNGDTRDAVVAVLLRERQVLVIRRAPDVIYPGYWTPLSGRVRVGETQEAAVVREVREEVALAATPIAKVWECDTEDGRFRLHWCLADARPGDPVAFLAEVAEVRWIHRELFKSLTPTFDDDRRFFEEVLPRALADAGRA